jgi:hypothetical protein
MKRLPVLAVAALSLVGGSAFAAVPTAVTDSLTTASTDVATLGAAVFAVMVGIAIWKWFRRTM